MIFIVFFFLNNIFQKEDSRSIQFLTRVSSKFFRSYAFRFFFFSYPCIVWPYDYISSDHFLVGLCCIRFHRHNRQFKASFVHFPSASLITAYPAKFHLFVAILVLRYFEILCFFPASKFLIPSFNFSPTSLHFPFDVQYFKFYPSPLLLPPSG